MCDPGTTETCYGGPASTEGVGACVAGNRSCTDDGLWGPCEGEVVPTDEICSNSIDDNCDGTVDEDADSDGDGFSVCQGDCCDVAGPACSDPQLVNPGAIEAPGNMVDDDCDGLVDNVAAAQCDTGLASDSADPLDFARAMELCNVAPQTPMPGQQNSGVLSATFTLASSMGTPAAQSRSIRPGFGTGTATRMGDSLVVLSSGHAAATGDTAPAFADFQQGQNMGTETSVPAAWLAANGGTLPSAPGCPVATNESAFDSVMYSLRIRVPSNANSFSVDVNFISAEYPQWVCSPFNDFFVVLLNSTFSGTPANPADTNLARYTAPDTNVYPVGVNLAFGDTGLFQQCISGATGCGGAATAGTTMSCTDASQLAGTGFDVVNPPNIGPGEPGSCGGSNLLGGGTGWLTTSGNVVPGEEIDLQFAIWDTGDPIYDSVVLLDNFRWSLTTSEPGTDIGID